MMKRRKVALLLSFIMNISTLTTASENLTSILPPTLSDWPDEIMKILPFCSSLLSLAEAANYWQPSAGESWNIQLKTVPRRSQAKDPSYNVWDFDMFEASRSKVRAFKRRGHKVICYFSAGSWEDWRPDAGAFPGASKGKGLDGWPGEKWLDTRLPAVRAIMVERIAIAKAKGCDGVDPDNVDGFINDSGFDLTKADAVDYVKFLARTAHDVGLSYGLKNGGDFVDQVIDDAEWVINEQCVQYNECDLYQPFIRQGKPVFNIEYTEKKHASKAFVRKVCQADGTAGFSQVIKRMDLTAWTTLCPS